VSDENKTPALGVHDGVRNGNVDKVEVLQESGKERSVNMANCAEMDNVCTRQADGGSEFLSEKAKQQDRNVKGPPKIIIIRNTIMNLKHGQSQMSGKLC